MGLVSLLHSVGVPAALVLYSEMDHQQRPSLVFGAAMRPILGSLHAWEPVPVSVALVQAPDGAAAAVAEFVVDRVVHIVDVAGAVVAAAAAAAAYEHHILKWFLAMDPRCPQRRSAFCNFLTCLWMTIVLLRVLPVTRYLHSREAAGRLPHVIQSC